MYKHQLYLEDKRAYEVPIECLNFNHVDGRLVLAFRNYVPHKTMTDALHLDPYTMENGFFIYVLQPGIDLYHNIILIS